MTFAGASTAATAVLGELSKRPMFSIVPWNFTGRFDSDEERVINGHRVHRDGDSPDDDRWLADVEGEVWIFSNGNAKPICPSSAGAIEALAVFRLAAPLAWSLVV